VKSAVAVGAWFAAFVSLVAITSHVNQHPLRRDRFDLRLCRKRPTVFDPNLGIRQNQLATPLKITPSAC
jgi:hypothetical protein